MLVRKKANNPVGFFDKTFLEYKMGFSARGGLKQQSIYDIFIRIPSGEIWLGLDNLHRLTSQRDYKLKITITDFDRKEYVAVYDQFKVRQAIQLLQFLSI